MLTHATFDLKNVLVNVEINECCKSRPIVHC